MHNLPDAEIVLRFLQRLPKEKTRTGKRTGKMAAGTGAGMAKKALIGGENDNGSICGD